MPVTWWKEIEFHVFNLFPIASKLIQPRDPPFTSCFSESTSFALVDESESSFTDLYYCSVCVSVMGAEADLESKRMPALARVVMFCQSTRKHMSAKHRLQVLTMLCECTVISRRIEGINRHFLLAFWLHTNMLISTRLYTHAHRCTHPFCYIHANKNNTWNLRQCSCYELCTCTPHSFTQITPQHCAPFWFNRKAYFFSPHIDRNMNMWPRSRSNPPHIWL